MKKGGKGNGRKRNDKCVCNFHVNKHGQRNLGGKVKKLPKKKDNNDS